MAAFCGFIYVNCFFAHFGMKILRLQFVDILDLNSFKRSWSLDFSFGGLLCFVSFPNEREGCLTDSLWGIYSRKSYEDRFLLKREVRSYIFI